MNHSRWMSQAYELACKAYQEGEVPVGAVIVHGPSDELISCGYNGVERQKNALVHAEVVAIEDACKTIGDKFLNECDLYVTLEPCMMCASAISLVRIRRLYFGAYDPKTGGVEHGPRIYQSNSCHHKPEVIGGVIEEECGLLMRKFFENCRDTHH